MEQFHGTTIISVRRKTADGYQVAIGGDGQVTLGNIVVKGTARKVRRLYHGKVLGGFAGATADAFTLFERFEAKLEKHQGHLVRAAIELTKDWRTDRVLRRLEAHGMVYDANRGAFGGPPLAYRLTEAGVECLAYLRRFPENVTTEA